jgi:hypothetical protein
MPRYNVIANANPKSLELTVAARPPVHPDDVAIGVLVSSETDPEKLCKHAEDCIGPLRLLVQVGESWRPEGDSFPLTASGLETAAHYAGMIAGTHAVKLVAAALPDVPIRVWPKRG